MLGSCKVSPSCYSYYSILMYYLGSTCVASVSFMIYLHIMFVKIYYLALERKL